MKDTKGKLVIKEDILFKSVRNVDSLEFRMQLSKKTLDYYLLHIIIIIFKSSLNFEAKSMRSTSEAISAKMPHKAKLQNVIVSLACNKK